MDTRLTTMALFVCAVVMIGGAAFAQPAITNGSFETDTWNGEDPNGYRTTITGWTNSGPSQWGLNQVDGPLAGACGPVPNGGRFLFVQGSSANTVSQNLSGWEDGYRYELRFNVQIRDIAPGMALEVKIGDKTIYGPYNHYYREGFRENIVPFRYIAAEMNGTDLKFITSWSGGDTTLLLDHVRLTYAQPVDFQTILTNFPANLDEASYERWSAPSGTGDPPIWTLITGTGKGYSQLSREFRYTDNTGNSINDDMHLGLLEPLINDDPCARELLGATKMNAIQLSFMMNRNFVMTREFSFRAELTNWTRIDACFEGCTISNRPAWTSVTDFVTNTSVDLTLYVDTGILGVGTTAMAESFDLTGLWGAGGLLNDFSAGFGDDLADLFAAYLTIGDQNKVDYMQHIVAEVMDRGFRMNLDRFILDLLGELAKKSLDDEADEADKDDKAHTIGAISDLYIQVAPDPMPIICFNGEVEGQETNPNPSQRCVGGCDWVRIRRIGLYVYGAQFQAGLQNWLNSYELGTQGLAPQVLGYTLAGHPTLLRAGGDLNEDSQTNLTSYNNSLGILLNFQIEEDAAIAQQFLWFNQPTAGSPLDYGASVTFETFAEFDPLDPPATYQWYVGTSSTNMQPTGPTTSHWFFDTDHYSFDATTRTRFYQVRADAMVCGLPSQIWSDVVEIVGGAPPAIVITGPTGGGDFLPGAATTLAITAECWAGLVSASYQWQKWDGVAWANIAGATAPSLLLSGMQPEDAGDYRCVVYNRVDGVLQTNPTYWEASATATVNVAPAIVITEQPQGADLLVGDNYTMSVAATVAEGTLTYQWQVNTGGAWGNAASTTTTLDIIDAQLTDAATYRVVITNTHPLGVYTLNSATANITVSEGPVGVVLYVDPTSPGAEDGLSWTTAYLTLQPAINAAATAGGGEVWVASATYNEARTENWGGVTGSLVMKDNVKMYGGFEGYAGGAGRQETYRYERRRLANLTYIDGSVARGGNPAYHVVVFGKSTGATQNAVLDGFVITGGSAAGVADNYHTWRGGGIYNYQSSPTIANCWINSNSAEVSGGGVANEPGPNAHANARIVNCALTNNVALRGEDGFSGPDNPPWSGPGGTPTRGGGAIYNGGNETRRANTAIDFVTMTGNQIGNAGYTAFGAGSAAVYTFASSPTIGNTIVWGNESAPGVAGTIAHTSVEGIYSNTAVTYSDVQVASYAACASFNGADADPLGPGLLYGDAFIFDWHLRLTDAVASQTGSWTFVPPDAFRSFTATWSQFIGLGDGADGMSFVYQADAAKPFGEWGTGGAGLVVSFLTYDGTVGTADYDLIRVSYNGATVGEAQIDSIAPALGLRTADWEPVEIIVAANGDIAVSWDGVLRVSANIADWDPRPEWGMGLGARTGVMYDLHGASQFCVDGTIGDLYAGTGNISADPLLDAAYALTAGSLAIDTAHPTLTVADDFAGKLRPVFGETALRSDMGAFEYNPAPVLIAACLNTTVDLTLRTSIEDLMEVFDEANAVVEAGLWYLELDNNLFTPADVPQTTRTLTVWDLQGQSDTCVVTVDVLDAGVDPCDPDLTPPVITLLGTSPVAVECGAAYVDAGATALDNCDGDITANIVVGGDVVDTAVPGTYIITYNVSDAAANAAPEVTRTVNVADTTPPVITRLGTSPVAVECGDPYTDAGATALDVCDGDLTAAIVVGGDVVNTAVPGAYIITYNVSDAAANPATEVTRAVNVVDTTAPVITMNGTSPVNVECGDMYLDTGATATDVCDGDLTGAIITNSTVNTGVPGIYWVTYDVSDAASNAAIQQSRQVNVVDTTPPVITVLTPLILCECGDEPDTTGISAADVCDGDLTANIQSSGDTPDPSTPGDYVILLDVQDSQGLWAAQETVTLRVVDTTPPVITLVGDDPVNVECGDAYVDAGATAADVCDGDLTAAILVGGDIVNTGVPGVYVITYNVSDAAANAAAEVTRDVNVVDTTAPVITLLGDNPQILALNDPYTELGATAADVCYGDLSAAIIIDATAVDTSTPGFYNVTYNVSDAATNAAAEEIRVVEVLAADPCDPDLTPPVITLLGDNPQTIPMGDPYVELGATADDVCDGDLTAAIVIDATAVDTSTAGSYPVTYNVSDTASNAAVEVIRTVNVVDTTQPYVVSVVVEANDAVLVTFSREMNEDAPPSAISALDPANYTISGLGAGSLNAQPDSVAWVSDTTYRLTWSCPGIMLAGGDVTVTVAATVEDSIGNAMTNPMSGTDVGGGIADLPLITFLSGGGAECVGQSRLIPVSFLERTNYDTGALVNIQDDPTAPDALWLSHGTRNVAQSVRLEMENPAENCELEGTQTFRALMRKDADGGSNITVTLELWENGVFVRALCSQSITSNSTPALMQCDWDASEITDHDAVELRISSTASGGTGGPTGTQRSMQIGAADWVPNFAASGGGGLPVVDDTIEVACGDAFDWPVGEAVDACGTPLADAVITDNDGLDNTDARPGGTYLVEYSATDGVGNVGTKILTVNVLDTDPPVITLLGDPVVNLECSVDTYTDAGATAADACDGDLTSAILVGGDVVDTAVPGLYVITYNVSDGASNAAVEVTRDVNVLDTTIPVITLLGAPVVNLECSVDTYTDAGATAADVCDGDLTAAIVVGGDVVDTAVPGLYVITYNVSDAATNAAVEVTRDVNVLDTLAPVITLLGSNPQLIQVGDPYVEQGATAADVCDGDLSAIIAIDATAVDTSTAGFYNVTYNVADAAMNAAAEEIRVVEVTEADPCDPDLTPPVITLLGSDPVNVECGDAYLDAGATALDNCDGDLTAAIVVGGDAVDTAVPGLYVITYNVSDAATNAAVEVTRDVNVVDTTIPVITLLGAPELEIECGDAYIDAGATAADICDGDLTAAIVVGGDVVDTAVPGLYVITYNVSDAATNAAVEVTRDVNVVDTTIPVITLLGVSPVEVELGDPYVDAGATAADVCDGDLTAAIVVGGDVVDTSTVGQYIITYNVADAALNAAVEVTRTVNVVDSTPLTVDPITDISLAEGAPGSLTAIASGGTGSYTYLWYRFDGVDYVPVVDGPFGDGVYAGATTSTLEFAPFTCTMAAMYKVEVDDGLNMVDTEVTVSCELEPGVPAASALGLVAIALAAALGGAAALRRRK